MQQQGPSDPWSSGGVGDPTVFRDALGATPAAPPRPSRTPLVVAAAVVAIGLLAVVTTTVVLLADGSDVPAPVAAPAAATTTAGAAAGTASATVPCTSTPTATASAVSVDTAGLAVTLTTRSTCADGQDLAAAGTTVLLRDGGTTVAAGVLDLAGSPVAVPGGGSSSVRVVFPPGSYWVVPASGTSGGLTVTIAEPAGTGTRRAATPGGGTTTVTAAAGTTGESPQALAAAALARQAAIDLPDVRARLAEQWEPQLSSKREGLVADGTVYDSVAILADHLALRARYPSSRLLQSGQWQTYESSSFWVTVSGVPSTGSDAALGWCRQQGIDGEHCSASFVSTVRGPTGVSAFQ